MTLLQGSFNMCIMKKDIRGYVYLTALCYHPYLVSLLFAVLLSLHLATFLI